MTKEDYRFILECLKDITDVMVSIEDRITKLENRTGIIRPHIPEYGEKEWVDPEGVGQYRG